MRWGQRTLHRVTEALLNLTDVGRVRVDALRSRRPTPPKQPLRLRRLERPSSLRSTSRGPFLAVSAFVDLAARSTTPGSLRSSLPSSRGASPRHAAPNEDWRRGWGSNPRWTCVHSGFQDRRFRPLSHPSECLRRGIFRRTSLPSFRSGPASGRNIPSARILFHTVSSALLLAGSSASGGTFGFTGGGTRSPHPPTLWRLLKNEPTMNRDHVGIQ